MTEVQDEIRHLELYRDELLARWKASEAQLSEARAEVEKLKSKQLPHMCRDEHQEIHFGGDAELCPIDRAANEAFERGKEEGRREASEELLAEADEIERCARTYSADDPGEPLQTLLREAGHYRRVARTIRGEGER